MKTTLNLIKQFVDVDAPVNEIAEKLTKCGFEIEDTINQDKYLQHVVVGKIVNIEKHPNADSLSVCTVDIGERSVQIITSAKNIFVGALVPVSLEGANLANGVEIKKSVLRGVESEGMFCSGEELGFGDDFYEGASINGILIFKDDFAVGTPVANALCLTDVIMDVNITANRPDAASAYGIAKEVAAIYKTNVKPMQISNIKFNEIIGHNEELSVEVKDNILCPIYNAAIVKNVKIQRSPLWLRACLLALDVKPINNIVDITNYILFTYGQPMHAFDLNEINGNKIIVDVAKNNETLKALNNEEIKLDNSMLTIRNINTPMVIAGVIGGVDSGISENTKTIVFESACFNRKSIRVTSRKIGVRTDSSARFERGVDAYSSVDALKCALSLISKLNAGQLTSDIISSRKLIAEPKLLKLNIKKMERILGIPIPHESLHQILNGLNFENSIDGDTLNITVMPIRADIENEADVAEEFIRLYGYDVYDKLENIPLKNAQITKGEYDPIYSLQRDIKAMLIHIGFLEALNYSLVNKNVCDKLNLDVNSSLRNMIKIGNAISTDLEYLRTTMAASLLNSVSFNYSKGNKEFKLMEYGRVYFPKENLINSLADEHDILAFISDKKSDNFFTFKGIIENILNMYSEKCELVEGGADFLHPGVSAKIILLKNKKQIGCFGKIHPKVLKNYDINNENVFYAEIDLTLLKEMNFKKFAPKPISKFQQIERDLAFIADESVCAKDIISTIKKAGGEYITGVEIFDIYRGANIPDGKKSIAVKLHASSLDHTLREEEINVIMKNSIEAAEKKLGLKLR